MSRIVQVAAVQMSSASENEFDNLERAERLIRDAAGRGANIVVCPELFLSPYFCINQDYRRLRLARPAAGHPQLAHFSALAAELGVVIPVGFYELANNAAFNSVAVIDADGRQLGVYRKTHIPDGPGYCEKFYFSPGDSGFRVWHTRFGSIGIGICWDQWYPETARSLALMGAEILCFPTIIGSEPQAPDMDTSGHWQRTMQGHAAANMVPVIAVNRIGTETATDESGNSVTSTFYGSSFIADATGAKVQEAGRSEEAVLQHAFDLDQIFDARRAFGFFRDRRPAAYGALLSLDGFAAAARHANPVL
jgi:N-carbamoylputrescine amidase